MAIQALHHFNLRVTADELAQLKTFYCDILGFQIGPRPNFKSKGVWLYANGHALIHITQKNTGEITPHENDHKNLNQPTILDHIALASDNYDAMKAMLLAHSIEHVVTNVPEHNQIQIFFKDPCGTGIELIFSRHTQ